MALVTGASRGIGAAYARALAARGYDLVLVSRDHERLEQLATELRALVKVSILVMDLSEPDAGHRLYAAVTGQGLSVDLLVHNAGFGSYGPFVELPMPTIQQMHRLHLATVLESTRLFLPQMVDRGTGGVIVVSSIAGFFSVPYLAKYAASKAFLLQFYRALAEELRPSGVTVQVCCPGTTSTDFHSTAGFRSQHPLGSQDPARVVAVSLAALGRRRTVVTIGWRGALLLLLSRWVPPSWTARGAACWMRPSAGSPGTARLHGESDAETERDRT